MNSSRQEDIIPMDSAIRTQKSKEDQQDILEELGSNLNSGGDQKKTSSNEKKSSFTIPQDQKISEELDYKQTSSQQQQIDEIGSSQVTVPHQENIAES